MEEFLSRAEQRRVEWVRQQRRLQTHTITLRITSDTDPHGWDWPTLLDLPNPSHVEVVPTS